MSKYTRQFFSYPINVRLILLEILDDEFSFIVQITFVKMSVVTHVSFAG